MTILTQHAPGTFCWPELATTDPNAAKKFYATLFGWTTVDVPMGEGYGDYTMLQKNGKDVGALFPQMADQVKNGVPPHWGAYVTVTSADQATAKAKQLGATVLADPMDVWDKGRMAVIQDPTGAVFSLWEPKSHIGAAVMDEPNSLCWTELMTPDIEKARAFYTSLIGWKTQDMPMPQGSYTLYQRPDGTNAAGMMQTPAEMKGVPPNWMSYFAVEDIQAKVATITQNGGKVVVPPTPIPGIGTFAVIQDPQGATFSLLQPS